MVARFKTGQPVYINGLLIKGIVGKVVTVLITLDTPLEYSYLVEYYKQVKYKDELIWERVEREFLERYLLPYDQGIRLLYLD